MSAIDFTNSYMTWFPQAKDGSLARIQLDAACTIIDDKGNKAETYYLIAPCRSERMYLDTNLFQMPNYEFCAVWGLDEFMLVRTHWVSERDNRQYGLNRERWADVHLDIRTFPHTRQLNDDAAVVKATMGNLPLIARTDIRDAGSGLRAILEYPVKTMNVIREPQRFQVDTGPLILPNFSATTEHPVEMFDIAHVVYNVFDKAEFILRRPTPILEGDKPLYKTTDYSVVQVLAARNDIFCADMG